MIQEKIYSILLVSSAPKVTEAIRDILPEHRFNPIKTVDNISSAQRELINRSYDFIIVNSPLPEGNEIQFSIDVSSERKGISLIMVRNDLYDDVYSRVSESGVYVLPKPLSRSVVTQSFDWLITTREMLSLIEKKEISLDQKMQEIRLVNRAKWALINNLHMSEPEAHRYIEKLAMDRCISKKETAEEILHTYN